MSEETSRGPRAFGPTAASILAAGIGCWVFGVLVALANLSESIADALVFMPEVGPLSGEAIIASVAYFASWKGLEALWKRRDPSERVIYAATAALVALGLALTFPPVFQTL